MSSLNSLIEPLPHNTSNSRCKIFESPVHPAVGARSHLQIVASPTHCRSNAIQSSNLIDTPAPHILILSNPKRKRPRLSNRPTTAIKRRKHGTSPSSQPNPNIHTINNE